MYVRVEQVRALRSPGKQRRSCSEMSQGTLELLALVCWWGFSAVAGIKG